MALTLGTTTSMRAADYTLKRLGLSDAQHTDSDGTQFSLIKGWSDSGYSIGYSQAYNSLGDFGTSGWWSDGQQVLRVGLYDAEHRSNQFQEKNAYFSQSLGVNNQGTAVGYSMSYSLQSPTKSAWMFDGTQTTRLGFTDAAHTGNVDQRETIVYGQWLTDAGDILGYSRRYNGTSNPNVTTAWLYRDGGYTELGLSGPAFLQTDGRSDSLPVAINSSGTVIGNSRYVAPDYVDTSSQGTISWMYDGQTTRPVGLVDPDALQNSAWKSSYAERMNQAGQVVGYAQPNAATPPHGYDAVWFYDGQATERIGLYGGDYVSGPNGYNTSRVWGLSETGHVIGESNRWNGTAIVGDDAWIYHEGVTTKIGLYGPEYSNSQGGVDASPLEVNDAGFAVGLTRLFDGDESRGQASWLYDGLDTRRVGHFDGAYISSDGNQDSRISLLLPNGDLGGYSNHYNGANRDGVMLWYYDYSDEQLVDIAFVASPSANSIQSGLSEFSTAGEIYGFARFFAGYTEIDRNVFSWAEATGMTDLLPRIADGDDRALFAFLSYIYHASPNGVLYGSGVLADGGAAPFMLLPVPEPASFILCLPGVAVFLLLGHRRAQK